MTVVIDPSADLEDLGVDSMKAIVIMYGLEDGEDVL